MATNVRFLGTTEEVTVCGCCGKENLKKTVAVSIDDTDPVFYGTDCAAQALKMGVKEVRRATRKADNDKADAKAQAVAIANQEEYQLFQSYLDVKVPSMKGARFLQLQLLGGYQVAHASYLVALSNS
jgi:hypothetical protein